MSAESTSRRIGTAMAWTVASRAGRFALGLATSVLVVRGLGSHDYGVLSTVRSVLMFMVLLAGAGTGQAILRFLPALRVGGAPEAARGLLRRVAVVHAAVWVVMLVLSLAFRGAVERVFHADGVGMYVVIGAGLAVFEVFFTLASHILNASFDTRRLSLAALCSHAVYLAAIAVTLPLGWGVSGVLVAGAAGNAVACAMVMGRVRAAVDFAATAPAAPAPPRLWRYSLPFAAIGVLNLVVWRQSETLLLAHFRTPEETGYFDLAYRLPQTILEFVPGTVWPLVMAGMSESFARDPSRLADAVRRYYRLLFSLCAPLCVLGAVLGGRAIEVLFDASMQPAAVPAQIFFLIFTVSFLSTPLSMVLYVLEKTPVNLLIYTGLAVVNVGLDLILIPKFGVPGAMVPVAIAIALQPIVYFLAVRRFVPGVTIPLGFIGKCFAASAPAVALFALLRVWGGAAGLAAAGLAGVLLIAVSYRAARVFGPEELAAVAAVPLPLAGRIARFLGAER
jgi:O-antigen/teichoic acid export membrane protein